MPDDPLLYDLVVVGAGSGGLTAAAGAAGLGLRVAIVEGRDGLGGDCAYFGCIPSKTLLHAARVAHAVRTSERAGLPRATLPEVRLEDVMAHVQRTIAHFTEGKGPDTPERFAGLGVDVHLGAKASFTGPREIRVGDRTLRARVVFLATGSRPAIPPVPGIEHVPHLTNETFYAGGPRPLPGTILIAGAGPIGVETAQAFHRLGSRVILVEPQDCILPREDHEISCWMRNRLLEEGIDIRIQSRLESVRPDGTGLVATLRTGPDTRHPEAPQRTPAGDHEVRADVLFLATGRKPNVEGLDLEKAGIAYTKKGITVDAKLRTSAKHVYAIGDVAGGLQFTHVAEAHARLALRNAFFPGSSTWSETHVPWATFTDPEIARVGLTEAEARERASDVIIHRFAFEDVDRAVADGSDAGLVKVVATRSGKVLGAHVAGPGAGEIVHEFVLAMQHKLTLADLSRTIHVYPTLALAVRRAADQHYRAKLERGRKLVHALLRLKGFRARGEATRGAIVRPGSR